VSRSGIKEGFPCTEAPLGMVSITDAVLRLSPGLILSIFFGLCAEAEVNNSKQEKRTKMDA
jgi:hypothetical protein